MTVIQEPITIKKLPSFSFDSYDKNVKTSRTPCNKNCYFNKKASHSRKTSSDSKTCFVCGSYLHLIKDCDLYKIKMNGKIVVYEFVNGKKGISTRLGQSSKS